MQNIKTLIYASVWMSLDVTILVPWGIFIHQVWKCFFILFFYRSDAIIKARPVPLDQPTESYTGIGIHIYTKRSKGAEKVTW